MKILECIPTLIMIGLCIAQPAWSGIYAYSAADGTVNLSNVPADSNYVILLPAPQEAMPAAAGPGKPAAEFVNKAQYDMIVAEIARAYGLDGALLHAVISVESRYTPNAVSSKGAVGLMQLIPVT